MTHLSAAHTTGQMMLELAQQRADRHAPGFSDQVKDFIIQYLRANGPTSGEVITNAAKRAGLTPPDDRAFGGAYRSLSMRGFIMVDGIVERFKGHGVLGARLWRLTRKGDEAAAKMGGVAE